MQMADQLFPDGVKAAADSQFPAKAATFVILFDAHRLVQDFLLPENPWIQDHRIGGRTTKYRLHIAPLKNAVGK